MPLRLVQSIALPNIEGRIDHLAVDVQNQRLFLAALVRRRELPFKVTTETPEDELLQPQARRAEILDSFYGD